MGPSLLQRESKSPFLSAPKPSGGALTEGPQAPAAAPQQPETQPKGSLPRLEYAMDIFGEWAEEPVLTGGAPDKTGNQAEAKEKPPSVDDYRGGLDKQIDAMIKGNRDQRAVLDDAKAKKLANAGETEEALNTSRTELLTDLKERSSVYGTDIKSIDEQLGEKPIKNPTAEQKALLDQKAKLIAERDKYKDQQTALQRWQDRRDINEINEKLQDPNLSPQEKQELSDRKEELATGLLSTTKHYQQFDPRWGDTIYGKDRSYSNMREAGCGPTALAILADFKDQEDPEGKASRGIKDYYNPRRMADYATNHGRVKGSGTAGATMFGDLHGSFPEFEGNTVETQKEAVESLRNGVPVAIVGRNIGGQGANGKPVTPYGGHFMVLNGVNDDGTNFDVIDGGRNNNRNIHSMTSKQLNRAYGMWNLK